MAETSSSHFWRHSTSSSAGGRPSSSRALADTGGAPRIAHSDGTGGANPASSTGGCYVLSRSDDEINNTRQMIMERLSLCQEQKKGSRWLLKSRNKKELILDGLSLSENDIPVLTVDIFSQFKGPGLEVLASTNYAGGDPREATWINLKF